MKALTRGLDTAGLISGIMVLILALGSRGVMSATRNPGYTLELERNTLESEIVFSIKVLDFAVHDLLVDGSDYSAVTIPEAGFHYVEGDPMAPVISFNVRISDTLNPVVALTLGETRALSLPSPIVPSQQCELEDLTTIRVQNKSIYSHNSWFPESQLTYGSPEILRDVRIMHVNFYPVRYNPVTQQAELTRKAQIRITYTADASPNQKTGIKPAIPASWGGLYEAVIANYDASQTVRRGEENYLVVAPVTFTPYLEEWITWKETEGYNVITLSIESGTTATALRQLIINAYSMLNRPSYVLLVGDENQLPIRASTFSYVWQGYPYSGQYTDDSFYSRLEGDDYLPDVYLGRWPARNVTDVQTMATKTFFWEVTPTMETNYYPKALMSCSGLYQSQQTTKEQVAERLYRVHHYQTVFEEYNWNGSTLATIINSVNNGISILNYRGEGWTEGWTPMHGYHFSVVNVRTLANANKPLILTSIGCGVCNFSSSTPCFGETWLQLGDMMTIKGAVAAMGPTYNTHTTFNNWMDRGIYRALAYSNLSVTSQAYLAGKLYMRDHLWTYPTIVEMEFGEFLLFGAPDVRYRTVKPKEPAWGIAFPPTNMDLYLAVRTTENWKAVGAKVVLSLPDTEREVLTLGDAGQAPLDSAFGLQSLPISISGYNIKPFSGVLDLTGDTGKLLITEVKPDIETNGAAGDIVEIYNADSVPIDLRNLIITDLDLYDIPCVQTSALLQPGKIAVIHFTGPRGEECITAQNYGLEIRSRAYPDFSAEEDQCVIRDYRGRILDALAWTNRTGQPVPRDTYRDLARFTPPTSRLTVRPDGWWNAPDDVSAVEYESYTIDWSLYAGVGGPGSIHRVAYPELDDKYSFEVREETTWGFLTVDPPTPTPLPTDTPLPTATMTLTPVPEPSPTPSSLLGVTFAPASGHYQAGEVFGLTALVANWTGGVISSANLVVFLDLGIDEYWFWPRWLHYPPDLDYQPIMVPLGSSAYQIIPPFTWPADVGSLPNVSFVGGLIDPALTTVLGELGFAQFTFD